MSELNIQPLTKAKYVVAVSGGVDSVTLLYLLKNQPNIELHVVYVNHNIRTSQENIKDEQLVSDLCKNWGMDFTVVNLKLGSKTSEDAAREARHNVLKQTMKSKSYNKIITAHHKDDVIETMIINLLRGTGRKGLSSLKNDDIYERPLLGFYKSQIVEFAKQNNLTWNEDSTNKDIKILRNYIRLKLVPKLINKQPDFKDKLYDIYMDMIELNQEIDIELAKLDSNIFDSKHNNYPRYQLIMMPLDLCYSWLHFALTTRYKAEVNAKMLKQARNFIQTAKAGKLIHLNKRLSLKANAESIELLSHETPKPTD